VIACIRVDDICHATETGLLKELERRVWRGRPVTHALVPRAVLSGFRRPLPIRMWPLEEVDFRQNRVLAAYLDAAVLAGRAEVAVHGLTHADVLVDGMRYAEFEVEPAPGQVEALCSCLVELKSDLEACVFVPPHNAAHPSVTRTCLEGGFHVCRSLTESEVAAICAQAGLPPDRDFAKQQCGFRSHGLAVELFQTLLLSQRRVRRDAIAPKRLVERFVSVVRSTGIGILTVHWWDFVVGDGSGPDTEAIAYLRDLLDGLECHGPLDYLGLADAAEEIRRRA
jgi:hypothetical protein